jgi:hypothetical protein
MNSRVTTKIIAVLIVGLSLGTWVSLDNLHSSRQGRAAFLAHQAHHFDRIITLPYLSVRMMIGGIIFAVLLIGFYELMVRLISKLLPIDQNLTSNTRTFR